MPFDHSRAQKEEEKPLLFPDKDSANEKPWTGFTTMLPAFFFSVLAGFLSLPVYELAHGPPWLQTQSCNSLLILNKPPPFFFLLKK